MNFHRIDPRALLVWRIRLCVCALLPSFLSALFFAPGTLVWCILTGLWVAAFLALFLWYYPLKYKKLSYAASDDLLVIRCGVIYTRRKSILIKNIQYITIVTLPLPKLFGLCAIFFQAAGGWMYLPCVRRQDAQMMQELFTTGRGVEEADG